MVDAVAMLPLSISATATSTAGFRGPLLGHPDFPDDAPRLKDLCDRLAGFDLAEPFARVRDAISEARKMGVTRAA